MNIGDEWDKLVSGCLQPVPGSTDKVATLACLPAVFHNVVLALLVFSGLTFLVILLFLGFKLVNSRGDAKNIQTAKQLMTYALAGMTLILAAYFIITIIGFVTGTKCIESFSFTSCQ